MMFNTYDTDSTQDTEESPQHRSKRNRRDVPDAHKLMIAPAHAKCYEGHPKYKWDLTVSQPYQQRACSSKCPAGCTKQTQTYCNCNRYKWVCKYCHVKHVIAVHDENNSDSSSQNSGEKRWKCTKKTKISKLKTKKPNPQPNYGIHIR